MAANIRITVDIAELKKKIAEAKYDIATLEINGTNVSIGGKRLNAEIKEVKKGVKEFHNEAEKGAATTAEAAKKATNGLKGMTAESKAAIGFIKNMIQGFLTPWTLLIIGIDLAWKGLSKLYDNLTTSITELIQKSQMYVQWTEKKISKFNDEKTAVDKLIASLDELNKKGLLGNNEMLIAQGIIDKLNKKYKDLHLTLEDVIGSAEDWNKAQDKINQANDAEQLQLLQQQYAAKRFNVEALMKDVLGDKNYTLDKPISGRDLFNWAQRNMPSAIGAPSNFQMREAGALYNSGNLTGKKEALEYVLSNYGTTDNNKVNEVITAFQQLIDLDDKIKDMADPRTIVARYAEREAKRKAEIEKEADSLGIQNDKSKQELEKAKKEAEFNALPLETQAELLQKEMDAAKKEIEATDKEIENEVGVMKNRINDLDTLTSEVKKKQNELDGLDVKIEDSLEKENDLQMQIGRLIDDHKKYYPGMTDAIMRTPGTAANSWFIENVEPLENQLKKLQEQRAAVEEERNNLTVQFTKAAAELADMDVLLKQSGLDYQKLMEKSISLQNQLTDATTKWGSVNSQILAKAAAEAQKYQKAENIIKNSVFNTEMQLLRRQGREREAIIAELTKNIEAQLERSLDATKDAALIRSIENQADMQLALQGLNDNNLNIQSDKVYSNELARMGGFGSSVVVDRMDVNKEILNTNKKSNEYLKTIESGIKNIHDDLNF